MLSSHGECHTAARNYWPRVWALSGHNLLSEIPYPGTWPQNSSSAYRTLPQTWPVLNHYLPLSGTQVTMETSSQPLASS